MNQTCDNCRYCVEDRWEPDLLDHRRGEALPTIRFLCQALPEPVEIDRIGRAACHFYKPRAEA